MGGDGPGGEAEADRWPAAQGAYNQSMTSREERAAAAQRRVNLSAQHAKLESSRAQVLIDEFVQQAKARGMEPVALKAKTLDGHLVKTDKRGWYIRQNRSLAIGTDGEYFVLIVPGGWMERLRGVKLEASDPPLYVGKGGRDGETGDLKEFLAWTLDGKVPQS